MRGHGRPGPGWLRQERRASEGGTACHSLGVGVRGDTALPGHALAETLEPLAPPRRAATRPPCTLPCPRGVARRGALQGGQQQGRRWGQAARRRTGTRGQGTSQPGGPDPAAVLRPFPTCRALHALTGPGSYPNTRRVPSRPCSHVRACFCLPRLPQLGERPLTCLSVPSVVHEGAWQGGVRRAAHRGARSRGGFSGVAGARWGGLGREARHTAIEPGWVASCGSSRPA